MNRILFVSIFGSFIAGLALGATHQGKELKQITMKRSDTIWIERPDGSLSCEPKSGRTLTQDAEELKKVSVSILDSKKGNDGKVHIQMCGAATGNTNFFLIPRANLAAAAALGFGQANPIP